MKTYHIQIPVPRDFNFWSTIYSHGWCVLPPFSIQKEEGTFSRIVSLEKNLSAECTLKDAGGAIDVLVRCSDSLTSVQKGRIQHQLSQCLRLDENLSEFYAEARRLSGFRWIPKAGAGRMLRAPTVFEDLVKMICTTNCSWALTESMVLNLTTHLGQQFDDGKYSFPLPEAIAGKSDAFLRKHIRAGYRSPYLLELSENVATGRVDLESWRSSQSATEDLFRLVRSVKGAGDYAAGNLLRLLGRYDYLGLDSWVRSTFYELHTKGRKVKDSTIERHYAPFGKYRGLFFWLEMTRHWYKRKFPF
jgi:3-methyladenine DNA glycosylase/8-oxoguanine DNA glycosylase